MLERWIMARNKHNDGKPLKILPGTTLKFEKINKKKLIHFE